MSRTLLSHDRQHGATDVHRTDQARRELEVHLLRRNLLEVARVEAGGVVDQHIDPAEAFDSCLYRGVGVGETRHVQLDRQQIARWFQRVRKTIGVAARSDD